ncbi:MAG: hypothetical protein HKN23_20620, partial [Verrucomicrobiales bacterium]|nr:hypothetical protein [Verrucomicrobiales bacterium]
NTLIREVYDWEPSTTLREGMEKTYEWIYGEMTGEVSEPEPYRMTIEPGETGRKTIPIRDGLTLPS